MLVMLVTCFAFAGLGYYELRCFRLPNREAIMKRLRMKSSHLNDGKGYNAHLNVDMPELIQKKPSHPRQDNLNENSFLTTPATLDKYPRGSCRLPCRIRQKLCPRRSSFENLPANILSAKEPREGASLVLGQFGDLSGKGACHVQMTDLNDILLAHSIQLATYINDNFFSGLQTQEQPLVHNEVQIEKMRYVEIIFSKDLS